MEEGFLLFKGEEMLGPEYHLKPVTEQSVQYLWLQKAAQTVEDWLTDSESSADKPWQEILDPELAGIFVFATEGNPWGIQPMEPVAYISQQEIAHAKEDKPAIHEITSVVVNPNLRGKGIGTALVADYAMDLQEFQFKQPTLVALASEESFKLFDKAKFVGISAEQMAAMAPEFKARAAKIGKIPVQRISEQPPKFDTDEAVMAPGSLV